MPVSFFVGLAWRGSLAVLGVRLYQVMGFGMGLYGFMHARRKHSKYPRVSDGVFYVLLAMLVAAILLAPSLFWAAMMATLITLIGYAMHYYYFPTLGSKPFSGSAPFDFARATVVITVVVLALGRAIGHATPWAWIDWLVFNMVALIGLPFVQGFFIKGSSREAVTFFGTLVHCYSQALVTLLVPMFWGRCVGFVLVAFASLRASLPDVSLNVAYEGFKDFHHQNRKEIKPADASSQYKDGLEGDFSESKAVLENGVLSQKSI